MKLSIITCLYNTSEQYVDECLKSIRNSSLKKEDYELLVIDDGSTKNYSEIIKKYDPVYVKTPNRGLLSARLYGVMIAKGEYIAFCDSDDTVSFNYYAPMLKKAYDENADVVINDWAFDTLATKYACTADTTIKKDIALEGDEILRFFASGKGRMHSYFVQWNKIFRKELLLKAKKELEKTDAISSKPFVYSEDVVSNFFVMKNAKKLVNLHTGYYFYRVHGAQSVATRNMDALKKEVDQMALSFDIMLANLPSNGYEDEIKVNIESWRAYMARKHYSYAKMQKQPEVYEYIKEKYKQDKLEMPKLKDSTAYIGARLLGDNLSQIDREISRFYSSKEKINLIYNSKDKYVSEIIDELLREGKTISKDSNKIVVIPKRKIKLKHKLTHSKLVCLIGASIFKKGSKMRALLKSKM